MSLDTVIIFVVLIAGFVGLAWWLQQLTRGRSNEQQMEDLVSKVFGLTATKLAEQNQQLMAAERRTIAVDLDNKRQTIEKLVLDLRQELTTKQEELRSFEKDRTQKFGELTSQLNEYRKMSEELRISTQQLAKVLSNNQTRGAWGERIIEDLLNSHGLMEGVHYVRQTTLLGTTLKPDITLLLPDKRVVAVDVKFPYASIQKLTEADSAASKNEHTKQFEQDLKIKIKKVAQYIDPEANTLDYAIMFVPNEMVFSFINQKFPNLVDEAMRAKVFLVSPFTFLMMVRTLRESYRHFMIEDSVRDVVKHLEAFSTEWQKFKDQLFKYGRSIDTLKIAYDELTGTRVRQLEKRMDKIDQVRGEKLPAQSVATELPKIN